MAPFLILAALAQAAPAAPPLAPPAAKRVSAGHGAAHPLTPAAEAALVAWRPTAEACKAPMATLPAAVGPSLAVRVQVEQCLREALSDRLLTSLPPEDRRAALSRAWGEIGPIDAANTAWLKTVIPADGWFRISRDGDEATRNAWLIVQHSPDRAWQAEIAKRMEPLAKVGEVRGGDYALIYDRVVTFAGRPQYYGSQYSCKDGRWVLNPVRDPAGVDARRKALGMSTVAENAVRMNAEGGC